MSKAFDYQTHHYNKEGRVTRETPYRRVCDESGVRMERPIGSGIWYAEDGTLLKDESAAIRAKAAAKAEADQKLAEQRVLDAREKLKAELRAEIAQEQKKAGPHGLGNKV